MNNLIRIIGPAPSELPFEELLTKLRVERDRVRRAIELFRQRVIPKTAKRQKKDLELERLMEKFNLTKEEVLKFLENL